MMWAPVAGVKKILPPAKFWPKPLTDGVDAAVLGPERAGVAAAASQAWVIAASASVSGVAAATGASKTIAAAVSTTDRCARHHALFTRV